MPSQHDQVSIEATSASRHWSPHPGMVELLQTRGTVSDTFDLPLGFGCDTLDVPSLLRLISVNKRSTCPLALTGIELAVEFMNSHKNKIQPSQEDRMI
eukprot:255654-Pyramimonas_sp.AAC.1